MSAKVTESKFNLMEKKFRAMEDSFERVVKFSPNEFGGETLVTFYHPIKEVFCSREVLNQRVAYHKFETPDKQIEVEDCLYLDGVKIAYDVTKYV